MFRKQPVVSMPKEWFDQLEELAISQSAKKEIARSSSPFVPTALKNLRHRYLGRSWTEPGDDKPRAKR